MRKGENEGGKKMGEELIIMDARKVIEQWKIKWKYRPKGRERERVEINGA